MGYHSTYLLKRILSSVATTLVYVAVDSAVGRNNYRRKPYQGRNYKKQENYYQRRNDIRRHADRTYKTNSESHYMRDNI